MVLPLQAAAGGLGAVLAMRAYVEEDIAMGRLASPFSLTVPKIDAFFLIHRPGKEQDPGLQAFTQWLETEIVEPTEFNNVD